MTMGYGHGLAPNEEEYQTFPSASALYCLQVDLDRPVIETSGVKGASHIVGVLFLRNIII